MLELILIFAVSLLVLPLIVLVFQPSSTDYYTKSVRFWSIVVIVLTLASLAYLLYWAHPVVHL